MDDFETLELSTRDRSMEVLIDAGSRFFAGHFPERPLLPAIALLVLVDELLRRCFGDRAGIVGVERARWTRPVTPGARLRVRLHDAQAPSRIRFEVESEGERVCEGQLTWREGEAD